MQNGAKPAAIAEMLDSDSFSEIKKNLKLADKASEELEAAQQQAQQEMQQQQMEAAQMAQQAEGLEKEKDRQKDIEIALINAESKNDTEGTSLALEKMMRDFDIKERELDLKTAEFEEKSRGSMEKESLARDSNTVKREGDQIKQQIAKENANKRN